MIPRRIYRVVLCTAAALTFVSSGAHPAFSQSSSAAAAEVRIQELEQEIRRLTGLIEEQSYEIRNLHEQMDRQVGDLTVRVRELEGGGGQTVSSSGSDSTYGSAPRNTSGYDYGDTTSEPMGSTSMVQQGNTPRSSSFDYVPPNSTRNDDSTGSASASPSSSGAPLPSDTPLAAYESAFALMKKSDFEGAEIQFANFLKSYPDSDLAPNAKYWYGETFYVRGDFEKASKVFAEAYQDNPKGTKAPDNLLKLGLSLAGLKRKDDACIALMQLEKDFSSTAGPIIRRAKQEMSKLGC
ncbi:MAG: tol-pal system protein YbgF [Alphaproteobacteria bacterium]|nr:tol-pal system protein YbgF [Alphaproteobacteria bacterium]